VILNRTLCSWPAPRSRRSATPRWWSGWESSWTSRRAGSGSRCSPPRWSPWPSSRCGAGVVRLANRLAYGPRAQPYEALSDFSDRLARTPSPRALLPAVAHAADGGLRPLGDGVPVGPDVDDLTATWGERTPAARSRTWCRCAPTAGTSAPSRCASPRAGRCGASDRRLLEALADQTAVAFRNLALERQLAGHVCGARPGHPRAERVAAAAHRGGRRRPPRARGGHLP
jgi:hypothetical protein